ncbi:MAG: C4-dicarboxylate ABC transporter permease, partial [Pseudolabrys sp.]
MSNKVDLSYGGIVRLVTTFVAVLMVIYHIWAIAFGTPEAVWFRGTHLLFAMTLVFIIHRRSGAPEGLPSALDLALLVVAAAPILYLFVNYDYIVNRIFYV